MESECEMSVVDNVIQKLKTEERFCDAKIVAKNGEVYVNLYILAKAYPFFEKWLKRNPEVVDLFNADDLTLRLFRHLVQFSYSGDANLETLNTFEILSFYRLSKHICHEQLTTLIERELKNAAITLEAVGKMFEVGVEYELQWLIDKCIRFVENNSRTIIGLLSAQSKNAAIVVGNLPKELILVISKSETFEATEVEVFELIRYWRELSKDIETSDAAFKNLRLELISAIEYGLKIKNTKLIPEDYYFNTHIDYGNCPRKERKRAISIEVGCENELKIQNGSCNTNASQAHKSLLSLFDGKSGDVAFFSGKDCVVVAHSSVLSASASYFNSFLYKVTCSSEIVEIHDLKMFDEKSIRLLLVDYTFGNGIDFNSLNEAEMVDMYLLTKMLKIEDMNRVVDNHLQRFDVVVNNFAELYCVAAANNLEKLLKNCLTFCDTNREKLMANICVLSNLPLPLIKRILTQTVDKSTFEVLDQLRSLNAKLDLSSIIDDDLLASMSLDEYIRFVPPNLSKVISEKRFMDAHRNKRQMCVNVLNRSCISMMHQTTICKPLVDRISLKHGDGITYQLSDINMDDYENSYYLLQQDHSLMIALNVADEINYISFQLVEGLYNFGVKVCVQKTLSDTTIVKSKLAGLLHASKQDIVFQLRKVRYIYITAFEGPLKILLNSIEAMFRHEAAFEAFNNGIHFASENLIADLMSKEHPIFRCGENEVIYALRYPFKLSSLSITFNDEFDCDVTLYTKANLSDVWNERVKFDKIDCKLPTLITLEKSLVSFIKFCGLKSNKIKSIDCPAKTDYMRIAVTL